MSNASDPASVPHLIESSLRVATWNVWWRFGPWERRLPLIIDELRRIDADVIALQEVWAADGTDSAAIIAAELGAQSVFAGTLEIEPGVRFGNAIISRWPITASDWWPLPTGGRHDEQRLIVRADIAGPRGAIQVFSTHLNWRFDHSAVRQQQTAAIARFVAESRPRSYPAVVCGDFNAEPHSAEVEALTGLRTLAVDEVILVDTWHSTHPTEPGFTWDNRNSFVTPQLEWNRRIDYVFAGWPKVGGAGHPMRAELIGTEPSGGMWPSDHFGLVTELRY